MQELKRREIPKGLLEKVLLKPEQIVEGHGGCRVYQSQLPFSSSKGIYCVL